MQRIHFRLKESIFWFSKTHPMYHHRHHDFPVQYLWFLPYLLLTSSQYQSLNRSFWNKRIQFFSLQKYKNWKQNFVEWCWLVQLLVFSCSSAQFWLDYFSAVKNVWQCDSHSMELSQYLAHVKISIWIVARGMCMNEWDKLNHVDRKSYELKMNKVSCHTDLPRRQDKLTVGCQAAITKF